MAAKLTRDGSCENSCFQGRLSGLLERFDSKFFRGDALSFKKVSRSENVGSELVCFCSHSRFVIASDLVEQ